MTITLSGRQMLLAELPTSGGSFRTTASINSALSASTPTNLFFSHQLQLIGFYKIIKAGDIGLRIRISLSCQLTSDSCNALFEGFMPASKEA